MKWIKRLVIIMASLVLAAVIGTSALLWYSQPDEKLDLHYEELSIYRKAEEMIRNREPALTLTEQEVNHLLKQAVVRYVELPPEVEITGARFRLGDSRLMADLQLRYRELVSAGATLDFVVAWEAPDLVISLDRLAVKRLTIPALIEPQSFRFSLEDQLPAVIDVTDVSIQPSGLRMEFAVDPAQLNQLLEELQQQFQGW
ncbi:hypothetical protein [Paenibacillus senegalensis]|uniref:hypothetical protein n=1 Tax=Paenibacillus senegalensis TaxID=1465766 RepID=UPI0002885D34|nr:hypothetical protein [Paenibacillus senegalensis]